MSRDLYMLNINIREEDNEYMEEIYVDISSHAWKRMGEREIEEHSIYSSILAMGTRILNFKCNQEFILVNYRDKEAVVCNIHCDNGLIIVEVITVIDTNYVYKHDGQRILVYNRGKFVRK
ncbi:MAG: hypothetical protein ACOCQD_01425 [archaeon]